QRHRVAQARKVGEAEWAFTWNHTDHLQSATRLTDSDGAEVRRLAYAAFGEEAENSGSGDAPTYTYTGKEQDASGLMYYGTRYYDPALARFITADTIYDTGPQGLNRYSYALNNPIIFNDPTGNYVSGEDDSENPTCYGCVTGSQEQMAEGTATVHDGRDGSQNQTLNDYDEGGYASFPASPRIYKPPYLSRQVDGNNLFGPKGNVLNQFMSSGWSSRLADQWDHYAAETSNILYDWVDRHPNVVTIAVTTFTQTAMDLGSGFVDTLRLGEGVAEGGAWGYGKDGLRVAALAYSGTKALRKIGVGGAYGSGRGYQWKDLEKAIERMKVGPIRSAMTPGWTKAYNFIQKLPGPLKKVGMKVFETANLAHYARATKLYTYGDYAGGFGKKEKKIVRFVGGIIEHIIGKP
ncbi:MAG: RHS repeat-associated core domain-containing protein, partial [Chloroflexi bacterium]|nr:RHS repeat-associated core domain-containing protein [Chloroflexota bacterium]